ncbi:DUF559 domain-containing protein [Carboxylicivirga sp. A043]|uniref:endonuclease domain-containing protein n=1 Tax=Carboxylicivirga litoralis TaxID=2816963 RepID=UPI0021CB1E89|nr:endonuclease domain-containing protein [Carboxylicivirga sp. A043]MCU4155058.1 DUF559 domain-containing protein [Carboxylicivirga sp. A043]
MERLSYIYSMTYHEIKMLARKLRNNPTPSEEKLWRYIRKKQLKNCRFLRQYPIIYQTTGNYLAFYIPDFYCARKKLVLELDGKIHLKTIERDAFRDDILRDYGLTVLRIENKELDDIDEVLHKIESYL